MDVLLVQPPARVMDECVYPIGLACVASILKKEGHNVEIFDANISNLDIESFLEKKDFNTIAVSFRNLDTGTNLFYKSFFKDFLSFLNLIKKTKPNAPLVVGGPAFSIFAEEIMKMASCIDYGLPLDNGANLAKLLQNMDQPEKIPGVLYRCGNHLKYNKPINEDVSISTPDYSFIDPRQYDKKGGYQIGVITKIGCCFRCTYCTYPALWNNLFKIRPIENVIDDIKTLRYNYGIKEIHFTDPLFNFPTQHAEQLLEKIINHNIDIKWRAYLTPKHVTKKFVLLAEQSGIDHFIFSPDGGSNQILKNLRKEMTTEDIIQSARLVKQYSHCFSHYSFMYNAPGENLNTTFDLIKTIIKLKKTNPSRIICTVNNIRIYPHTDLYRYALEKNIISETENVFNKMYYDPYPYKIISKTMLNAQLPLFLIREFKKNNLLNKIPKSIKMFF